MSTRRNGSSQHHQTSAVGNYHLHAWQITSQHWAVNNIANDFLLLIAFKTLTFHGNQGIRWKTEKLRHPHTRQSAACLSAAEPQDPSPQWQPAPQRRKLESHVDITLPGVGLSSRKRKREKKSVNMVDTFPFQFTPTTINNRIKRSLSTHTFAKSCRYLRSH